MAKRPSKSETLTIRLDPKTRFMLEFVSRLRGQTITTVVERAISSAADRATIGFGDDEQSWRDFWSVYEGERALKIAAEPTLHPTYEEEKRLEFTRRFWPFFYHDRKGQIFRDEFVDILWPHIDYLISSHDEMKARDINAGPSLMADLLNDAKVDPPQWPPPPQHNFGSDFPDELPF